MSAKAGEIPIPVTCHILLRAAGAADFKRAGSVRFDTLPAQGAVIEFLCNGQRLRGRVEAVMIPPGCEENCIGTVFLAEG